MEIPITVMPHTTVSETEPDNSMDWPDGEPETSVCGIQARVWEIGFVS